MRRGMMAAGGLLVATACAAQVSDQEIKRFALGFMSYYPETIARLTDKTQGTTPAGPYVQVQVDRVAENGDAKDHVGMLIDPAIRMVAAGLVFPMPPIEPPVTPETLPLWVQEVLPQVLGNYLGTRVRVPWPMTPARPSPVLFLTAQVTTGYGTMNMPLALSSDGKFVALGASWPVDRDPRAVRREVLENAYIQWDAGHEKAILKVVEFSDFECPACKRGWGVVEPAMAEFGDKLRHGMVNWPIVSSHPWAFRAAVAGECIGLLWPGHLLDLKEEFYRLQGNLSFETVDPTVFGFLAEYNLDKDRFLACYLKDPAIDTVLKQMELGYRMGAIGTPTYYVNGESVPWGDPEIFRKRLEAILAAGGRPEAAADIVVGPKATPSGTAPSKP
jgi:protein-disulfide isomerase